MDLYLQSLSVSPWQLQRSTEGVPLSCSSLQLGLLARKSRLRSVRCSVVDGEGDTAQEKSAAKGLAPESWLQADANADPYFGWTSDGSQTSDNSTAGWIKIGGGVVLAIGFALGARTMYTRKEAARQLGVLPPVTEQTVSPSKASKSAEVQDYLDGSRDMIDSLNSNQEEFMKQEKETQTDGKMPDVQHQEKSTPAGLPKMLGRVVVPAPVDHMQEQVLAALQALKVIEAGVEPGGICTRREYARWLILASATLSRSPAHKVFPAMYIENASKLAYDDVLPEDPDFPFIQGLAEAGLISSRLLGDDKQHEEGSGKVLDESNESVFSPDSPLTRQDLITWKVDFERKPGLLAGLPSPAQKEALQEISGFVDIDKIHQDAWPSLLADIKAGERSIINLAFGYTRRFQPEKPVTKAQAAVALATNAWEHVSEELARLEAESIAEAAVAAELALETKAQQEVAAAFNELLQVEREKQQAAVSLVETVQAELQQAKAEREEEKNTLLKERAVLDSEKELLSNFKHEVEEQAMALSCAKLEVAFEREKVNKLHAEVEEEREMISKVQSELEIEKNALTLARAWAEDEARKALAHSKVLEQARKRWESQGVQVHVDKELDEMNIPGPSWHYSEGFKVQKSPMDGLITKSRDLGRMFVDAVMRFFQFIQLIFHTIKQRSTQLVGGLVEKFHEAKIKCADTTTKAVEGMKQTLPSSVAGMTSSIREGTLKAADEWKGGAEKLVQKFKLP